MAWPDPFSTRRWTHRTCLSFLRRFIASLFLRVSLFKWVHHLNVSLKRCHCDCDATGYACWSLQMTLMHIATFKKTWFIWLSSSLSSLFEEEAGAERKTTQKNGKICYAVIVRIVFSFVWNIGFGKCRYLQSHLQGWGKNCNLCHH